MRRLVVVVGALVVIIAGGLFYVGHHPAMALPVVARSAGPTLVNDVLTSHPISLTGGGGGGEVRVAVAETASSPELAHTVAEALSSRLPSHFAVPKSASASIPAALRPFTGSLAGLDGTVSDVQVEGASGTAAGGQAEVAALITVAGRQYQVSGTVLVSHGAITGVSALTVQDK